MPEHEFLFVGGGRVRDLVTEGYHVQEVPMGSTLYRDNRVDITATVSNAAKVFLNTHNVVHRVAEVIDRFDPDLILTDYEYFTPLAARKLGRPCVSLDHQHALTHCIYTAPRGQRLSRFMTCFTIRRFYSSASRFIIISFYELPPKNPRTSIVLPPIIRNEVAGQRPSEGDHVLVYQTSPTFYRLLPALEKTKRRFVIYGLAGNTSRKNLVFKAPSREGFIEDLASCRYVITNGGHNVVSEALYLGKPVLAFPIANAYEQFLNSHFLREIGYGDYSTAAMPSADLIESFENRLDRMRGAVRRGTFLGNQRVVELLNSLISRGEAS
jgi:uncharacterized protein (TIGR00661 family)